jgi:hypothetical protein
VFKAVKFPVSPNEKKNSVAQGRMGKVCELLAGNGIKIGHPYEAICF